MSLKSKLDEDLKDAMRNRDALKRSVIRLLLSAIHNEEIAVQKEIADDGIIQVLSRQAQQRRDSIEAYEKGNRADLADKERSELNIILEYLPQQLSKEEISEIAREVVESVGASGPQDMGKVMGQIMPKVRGRAEGREVNAIVSEMLKNLAG